MYTHSTKVTKIKTVIVYLTTLVKRIYCLPLLLFLNHHCFSNLRMNMNLDVNYSFEQNRDPLCCKSF